MPETTSASARVPGPGQLVTVRQRRYVVTDVVESAIDARLSAGVEMILRAVEDAMLTASTESITIHGKLTVEHILPQSWNEHWPLPPSVDEDTASDRREELVHDFGNLTLLTLPLNSGVSNGAAKAKLPKIAAQSALRLNAYFQNRETWDENDITARSAALFKVAKKIWPGS
jgi:hypothetical protein